MDKLDQAIAKYNFARSHGYVVTDLKSFRTDWFFADQSSPPVLPEIGGTANEIHPALFNRRLENFRIGQREIDRREDIEELARHE